MASGPSFKVSIQVSKEEFLSMQKQAKNNGLDLNVWIKQRLKSAARSKRKSTNDNSQLVLFNQGGILK